MSKPQTLPDNLQSVAYWSQETGLSSATIRRMIARGQLRAYRFGPRVIRIAEADLMAVFEQVNPSGYELAHA